MRHTKIIATIGPATDSPDTLSALMGAGVDVARLNASHSTLDELGFRLSAVRAAAGESGRTVAVMLDLPGPKIRLANMAPRRVAAGDSVSLVTSGLASADVLVCTSCEILAATVVAGDTIVVGDGEVELEVTGAASGRIDARVAMAGTIEGHKGITARNVVLPLQPVTTADEAFIRWGVEAGVDLVAQSFVQKASDVDALRLLLGDTGIQIVAKIERPEAVADIEAIARSADAIMVARGDLGVASAPECVPVYQKRIVRSAREQGKPVIIATQMLESMLHSPRPTRAEASDVANAVFDSVDAVMLSAETAVGEYPVETVATMARIVVLAEEDRAKQRAPGPRAHAGDDVPWAVSASVAELARSLDLAAIVTATKSGATARFVAAHRPEKPIVAVTASEAVARRLALVWGVTPVVARESENLDDRIGIAAQAAMDAGYPAGALIAITAGVGLNRPGLTDLIHVHRID